MPLGEYAQNLGPHFAPKIKVAIANDPNWSVGSQSMPRTALTLFGLVALIDTGSDVTRIDEEIAKRLNLVPKGNISSNFTDIEVPTSIYSLQVCLPESKFVMGGEFTAVSLRASQNFHDAILGLDFLEYFDLRIAPKTKLVEMTFVGV